MSQNPLNLLVRFLLELAILFALGYWGWTQNTGLLRWFLALGLPLLAAILWGTFRTPGDAPRDSPVPVPGWLRLALEWALFAAAAWAFCAAGRPVWGVIFAGVSILHYLLSYDRILQLVRGGGD